MAWLAHRVDDMHAFHSRENGFEANEWTRTLDGLHTYDSVAVFEKGDRDKPVARKTGRPAFALDASGVDVEQLIDDDHRAQLAALNRPIARLRRARRDPKGTWTRAKARWHR